MVNDGVMPFRWIDCFLLLYGWPAPVRVGLQVTWFVDIGSCITMGCFYLGIQFKNFHSWRQCQRYTYPEFGLWRFSSNCCVTFTIGSFCQCWWALSTVLRLSSACISFYCMAPVWQ